MTGLVADFATRLTFGLALALLVSPWGQIPPKYFRTICLVLLGLALLAAFDLGFAGKRDAWLMASIFACVGAYAGSIAWGLGFVRLGQIALAATAASALFLQFQHTGAETTNAVAQSLVVGARLSSGFFLGTTLAAMLLGHHYLTAPAMSIAPLQRMIQMIAIALLFQAIIATTEAFLPRGEHSPATHALLLSMRWGFGILAPAIGTFLAWRTAQIRSTQSATGILYAVTTLALLGELAGLVLGRTLGVGY